MAATQVSEQDKLALVARVNNSTVIAFLSDREQAVINLLALLTLVVTFLIRVPGSSAAPWFSGGGEWAGLVADLGVGYLAAWFFYYLVNWRPAYQARQRTAALVAARAWAVLANADQVKATLRAAGSSDVTGPMSRQELRELAAIVTFVQPSSTTNILAGQPIPVVAALRQSTVKTREAVGPILQFAPIFDSKIIIAAASVSQASFVELTDSLTSLASMISPSLTLASFEAQVWDFLVASEELWLMICDRYPAASAATVDMSSGPHHILTQ
jgi:hypothetical protein